MLNFSNPERRARITVTSRSGHRLDWWIYLETYDPFFLGTWRIVDVKLACNQRVSGVGDGAWTTQLSSGEFGTYGLPEYDDRVTITLGEISDNSPERSSIRPATTGRTAISGVSTRLTASKPRWT